MIYNWYKKHFSHDKVGLSRIKKETTFDECWKNIILNAGVDIDELLFIDNNNVDSEIREKIFRELSIRYKQSYQYIHDLWSGDIL